MSDSQKQPDYPVEKSMMANNTTYIGCDVRGGRHNYAVCLHTIKAFEEERLAKNSFSECQRAIVGGYCPAKNMREEERKLGVAKYYQPRKEVISVKVDTGAVIASSGSVNRNSDSYKRGYGLLDSKKKKSKPALSKSAASSRKAPVRKAATLKSEFKQALKESATMTDVVNDAVSQKSVSVEKVEKKEVKTSKKSKAADIAKMIMSRRG